MEVSKEARPGLPIHLAGRKEDTDKGEAGKRPSPRTNSLVGNWGTKKECIGKVWCICGMTRQIYWRNHLLKFLYHKAAKKQKCWELHSYNYFPNWKYKLSIQGKQKHLKRYFTMNCHWGNSHRAFKLVVGSRWQSKWKGQDFRSFLKNDASTPRTLPSFSTHKV